MDVAVATPNTGVVNVLLESVSAPANVANVPVVGKVMFVAPVATNVCAKAPLCVTLPAVERVDPSANVNVAPVAGVVRVTLLILPNTWKLRPNDTSLATNKRLLNDTSLSTKRRLPMDTSPVV